MPRLPTPIVRALAAVSSPDGEPSRVAQGLKDLLSAELACADLSRGIEAFREASRSLGILDESRSGQRVYDAWSRLSHFFLGPLGSLKASFCADGEELSEVPAGFEALGIRWERTVVEVSAFFDEEQSLDRVFLESPVSTHVGFRIRSRLLLLDRRAERLKVALELVHREILLAARGGVTILSDLLAGGSP